MFNNLAYIDKYKNVKKRLFKQMEKKLKKDKNPRIFGKRDLFDKYSFMGKKNGYSTPIYLKND